MKYILTVMIVCLLFITGCFSKNDKSLYLNMVENLQDQDSFIKEDNLEQLPYNVEFSIDNVSIEEIQYRIVIDEVNELMTDIKSIVIHDRETNDIFPSIGIVDDVITLEPDGNNKGFILVGYLDFPFSTEKFHGEFRLFIQYIDKNNYKKEDYFIFRK